MNGRAIYVRAIIEGTEGVLRSPWHASPCHIITRFAASRRKRDEGDGESRLTRRYGRLRRRCGAETAVAKKRSRSSRAGVEFRSCSAQVEKVVTGRVTPGSVGKGRDITLCIYDGSLSGNMALALANNGQSRGRFVPTIRR